MLACHGGSGWLSERVSQRSLCSLGEGNAFDSEHRVARVANIKANPKVGVSFIDVFAQKGYKLRGRAELIAHDDARYRQYEVPLLGITKGVFRIVSIIAVQAQAVEPMVAPSYRFLPGTTEASQVASAMRAYGVAPRRTA